MKNYFTKLKTKWKINRTIDLVLILVCFSLAGSTETFVIKPFLRHLGVTAQTPIYLRIGMFILFIMPLYWAFLLIYGLLLGQFNFFWGRLKMIGNLLRKSFVRLFRFVFSFLNYQGS